MAVQVLVAKMTDFVEEGVILSWLIKEGEAVEEGQPLLELETDKAVAELESPASGFLKGIRSGAVASVTIPVGETIAYIVDSMDEAVGRAAAAMKPRSSGRNQASNG